MFGFPRLRQMACGLGGGAELIDHLRSALADFTGAGLGARGRRDLRDRAAPCERRRRSWRTSSWPSAPDNEREAMEKVAAVVAGLGLPPDRLERLKTAVAEATMNAMEHGNHYDPDKPVRIQVRTHPARSSSPSPTREARRKSRTQQAPDLDAKLEGLQSPRGWGLFLIRSMVDEMRVSCRRNAPYARAGDATG